MPANKTPHTAEIADAIRRAYVGKSEADPHGSFVSLKNLRDIPVWSDADRRFCEMADRCPRIVSYEERPDILILDDRGHAVPFVIDFAVVMDGRRSLVGLSLRFPFPDATEAHYVRLARTLCAMKGEEFVSLSRADLGLAPVMPEPPGGRNPASASGIRIHGLRSKPAAHPGFRRLPGHDIPGPTPT